MYEENQRATVCLFARQWKVEKYTTVGKVVVVVQRRHTETHWLKRVGTRAMDEMAQKPGDKTSTPEGGNPPPSRVPSGRAEGGGAPLSELQAPASLTRTRRAVESLSMPPTPPTAQVEPLLSSAKVSSVDSGMHVPALDCLLQLC